MKIYCAFCSFGGTELKGEEYDPPIYVGDDIDAALKELSEKKYSLTHCIQEWDNGSLLTTTEWNVE